MRTLPFKQVYDAVVRLHGGNPRLQRDEDLASTLVMHINSRVEQAILAWNWPEWEVTEERAFRQTWFDTVQYLRVNDLGVPDEIFYIPTTTYYQVNPDSTIDPPVGTLPTALNPTNSIPYFLQLTRVDPYIEYDQPFKTPIGQVLGIYSLNPTTVGCCSGPWMLRYHPSEKGIAVCGSGPTVFILYQLTVPTYSMQMHIPGTVHPPGDVVLDETTFECYQAVTTTTDSPSVFPAAWTRVPFLAKWYDFVRWGAFADSLAEVDQGGAFDPNTRMALLAKAESNAMQAFQSQVDALVEQGQRLKWNFQRQRYWCESIPWTGGTVATLQDVTPPGFQTPPPVPPGFHTPPPVPSDEYHPEIQSLSSTPPALNQIPTLTRLINSLIKIIITPAPGVAGNPEQQIWRLEAGTAQVGNPSELNPLDYDPIRNSRHWRQIS